MTDKLPDVVSLLKQRQSKAETAASGKTAKDARQQTKDAPGLVECVIGPVGGPYKPCLFSADANVFMPVFKE